MSLQSKIHRSELVSIDGHFLSYSLRQRGHVGVYVSGQAIGDPVKYFEIEIINTGDNGTISIGLVPFSYSLSRQPGWDDLSVGYHADDGNLFHGHGIGSQFGPICGAGDRMGCGYNNSALTREKMTVFFTKNGSKIGEVTVTRPPTGLYPAVGMHSRNEKVKLSLSNEEWHSPCPVSVPVRMARIIENGNVIRYSLRRTGDVGVYVCGQAIGDPIKYFELEIINTGGNGTISIGLVPVNYPLSRQPGWNPLSVGYHADDGKLFHGNSYGSPFGPICKTGDRMGCGYNSSTLTHEKMTVFFTKNGSNIGEVTVTRPPTGLYPAIGMHSRNENVKISLSTEEWHAPHPVSVPVRMARIREVRNVIRYAPRQTEAVGVYVAGNVIRDEIKYFEVEILNTGDRGTISIGLVPVSYPLNRQPGWNALSVGYHADDGKLFQGEGSGTSFGPICTMGDRMGCGYKSTSLNRENITVFFTKNGVKCSRDVVLTIPSSGLFPAVGMHSRNEKVKLTLSNEEWQPEKVNAERIQGMTKQGNILRHSLRGVSCEVYVSSSAMAREHSYFEVEILNTGAMGAISMGLVPAGYPLDQHPGWWPYSVGYHADDGQKADVTRPKYGQVTAQLRSPTHPVKQSSAAIHLEAMLMVTQPPGRCTEEAMLMVTQPPGRCTEILFKGACTAGTAFGQPCEEYDRMGCGVRFRSETDGYADVFFTKNAVEVGTTRVVWPLGGLFPAVGMQSAGEAAIINLEAEFLDDPPKGPIMATHFADLISEAASHFVPGVLENIKATIQPASEKVNGERIQGMTKQGNILRHSLRGVSCEVYVSSSALDREHSYFEVEILNTGAMGAISMGLVPAGYPLDQHPGWRPYSVGYHADDGKLFKGAGTGRAFGQPCEEYDRMGCGVRFRSETDGYADVFFTKNVVEVGTTRVVWPPGGLFPAVGMQSAGEAAIINLKAEFLDDPPKGPIMATHFADLISEAASHFVPGLLENIKATIQPASVGGRLEGMTKQGNVLRYSMTAQRTSLLKSAAVFVSEKALSSEHRYFEVEILSTGRVGAISMGLVPAGYPMDQHPGWKPGSVAYHADDGKLFTGAGMGSPFGPICKEGDRMGCGIRFGLAGTSRVDVHFTRNGVQVGMTRARWPEGGLFPAVGMESPGEAAKVHLDAEWNNAPDYVQESDSESDPEYDREFIDVHYASWNGEECFEGDEGAQSLEGADEVQSLIQSLASVHVEHSTRNVVINREDVWGSALKYFQNSNFSTEEHGSFNVSFTDATGNMEGAEDFGGPRREFFHLLLKAIRKNSGTLTESPNGMLLTHNIDAQFNDLYRVVGRMLATIIVQGGEAPAMFTRSVVDYIVTGDLRQVTCNIDDIPDTEIRTTLQQVDDCTDVNGLKEAIANCEWRFDINGLPHMINMDNKKEFINKAFLYYTILKPQAVLDQLIEGLGYYEFLKGLRENPSLRVVLEYNAKEMTADDLYKLFDPMYSVHNDARTSQEMQIMEQFKVFLLMCEEGSIISCYDSEITTEERYFIGKLKICDILQFCTGGARIPVTGYDPDPCVSFVHDDNTHWPCAYTCNNEISFFVNEKTVSTDKRSNNFCKYFVTSLMNGQVFSHA